jgi:uncharacterized protein (TIGR00661 family)
MKALFIVQGEGKGHLTQAIALYQMFQKNGHEVVATMVGVCKGRPVPSLYTNEIAAPLYTFDTPSLSYGKGKAPSMQATLFSHIKKYKKYIANAHLVHQVVETHRPHVIVNFYEIAGGFYKMLYSKGIPMVCVGHQYLLLHQNFENIKGKILERYLLNLNTKLTCWGASKLLGLSFREIETDQNQLNLIAVPPLLRGQIKKLNPYNGNYLLAYVTHHRLAEDIIDWHKNNKKQTIHCFVDKTNKAIDQYQHPNFRIHPINAEVFLQKMEGCTGLVSTAGFESVCEAMYLGKPVLMVPVPKHIEQRINAHDGQLSGAGIFSKKFKINRLINYLPQYSNTRVHFGQWAAQAEHIFLQEIQLTITQSSQAAYMRPYQQKVSFWQVLNNLLNTKPSLGV